MKRNSLKFLSASWRDDYSLFDFWTIVHILWGVALGVALPFVTQSFWPAFWIALVLIAAWEFFEYAIRIIEPFHGVVSDFIVGVAGFLIGFRLISEDYRILFLVGAVILAAALEYIGWRAWRRRARI